MIQCQECEYFHKGAGGSVSFSCDPFGTIKEPECLIKWQLLKLDTISRSHQATLQFYQKFAPLQEKMLRHMEREIDDIDEAEKWRESLEPDDEDENHDEGFSSDR